MRSSSVLLILLLMTAGSIYSQIDRGKEPDRIRFAKGAWAMAFGGSITGNEIDGYVFAARKGQTVTITNPRSELFSFNLFNETVTTEDIYEPTYSFVVPKTGDYGLYIKKMIDLPLTAKYSISMRIR